MSRFVGLMGATLCTCWGKICGCLQFALMHASMQPSSACSWGPPAHGSWQQCKLKIDARSQERQTRACEVVIWVTLRI